MASRSQPPGRSARWTRSTVAAMDRSGMNALGIQARSNAFTSVRSSPDCWRSSIRSVQRGRSYRVAGNGEGRRPRIDTHHSQRRAQARQGDRQTGNADADVKKRARCLQPLGEPGQSRRDRLLERVGEPRGGLARRLQDVGIGMGPARAARLRIQERGAVEDGQADLREHGLKLRWTEPVDQLASVEDVEHRIHVGLDPRIERRAVRPAIDREPEHGQHAGGEIEAGEQVRAARRGSCGPRGRPYSLSRRRAKPRSPWGMKITMAVKMIPTGIR